MDLTETINTTTPAQVVDAWHEAQYQPRVRLGLSEIGHQCQRYLWYRHHGFLLPPPAGRVLRLFRMGNIIEEQAVIDLKTAGYHVHSQQREVSITDGGTTLTGHIDGIIEGLIESKQPHLLEVKSSSEKRFNELKKVGYERWDEKYRVQVHVYMVLLKLKRCLVWVENKNTSEAYTERIDANTDFAVMALERAFSAISSPEQPVRKCPNASWYEAKWCGYCKECFW